MFIENKCLNGIKGSKKGESRYETMDEKPVLNSRTEELTEVIQKRLAEDQNFSIQILEKMTGINRETPHKILVEDLKKKKVCARFVHHLLTPNQKHQRTASSVELVE
jgi:hypothetical protein